MSSWKVVTYYRFVNLPDFQQVKTWLEAHAAACGVLGTILVADEGFNSSMCGQGDSLGHFFNAIAEDERFANLTLKWSEAAEQPFHKMRVRIKKEIVRMKQPDANPLNGVGEYIEPSDWNSVISKPDVAVIDVRNRYETGIGTFEGAEDPNTLEFWEFPKYIEEHHPDKSQPLALFCTGGIRCERATAFLVQRGYEKVMHLNGGILRYLEEIPAEESKWKGACFVFDDRRAVDHSLEPVGLP